ncbi:MAG: DUF4440 domain-containing protein [Alphaproteobacteria bacterium]|nr:DUF4440 domain-containing protein [Alphaproteobacteria bacterium]
MTPDEMKSFVAGFLEEVWNRGDLAAADRYLAPEYVIRHDPGDPWDGATLDRDGFRDRLIKSRAPFPDQRFSIVDAVAEDGRVAVAWRWSGSHQGEVAGIPPTGRTISMSGITFYYIVNGRLTGHWQEVDRLGMFRQLTAG